MPASEVLELVGRSSSHFTRIARIFAEELGVEYSFRIVADLRERDAALYGNNPALKIPVLLTDGEALFGCLNICRRLASRRPSRAVVWPEDASTTIEQNACEMVLQAMQNEVALIMAGRGEVSAEAPYCVKLRASLLGCVQWLEGNLGEVGTGVSRLTVSEQEPLRFFDVALFCLLDHLSFAGLAPLEGYPALSAFAERFAPRPSVQRTPYFFDAPSAG